MTGTITPTPAPPNFADLEKRRDAAIKRGGRWLLSVSNLYEAYKGGMRDFNRANLYGANLRGANLYGANLYGVNLIKTISGVGDKKRLIFAYLHDGEIRIQAGCRNGTPAEIRKAVKEDYTKDSDGYADYLATVKYLEDWGKRELKRLTETQDATVDAIKAEA